MLNLHRLDFKENADYIVFAIFGENPNSTGGRPSKDYFYTIDAAKEISKGKEARKYFIECERQLKEQVLAILNYSFNNKL